MKARETLVLLLVLSMAVVPILAASVVRSQSTYDERIVVYTAGPNAYTFITMNQINSTNSKLTAAESTSGLSGYRLVAVSSQNIVTDYQVFGVNGYNLLKVPFLPGQGLFLTVDASSVSAASPIVSYFGGLFATNFTTISSNSTSYSYFGSVTFKTVAAPILFRLVPTTEKGFSLAYTESDFSNFAMPSVILTGEATSSGGAFTHTISLGDASTGVIGTDGKLDFLDAVSQSNTTISASSTAAQSLVVVHSLDGFVYSTDANSNVSNAATGFGGNYTLTATAGKAVEPNVTIDSQVPTLNAYRTVSITTQGTTEILAVTVYLSNTAQNDSDQSMVIQNVTIDDNWWQKYPTIFQLANGTQTYNTTVSQIVGGHNVTEVYHLQVVSSSPQEFVVPSAPVYYSYTLGGTSVGAHTMLNEIDLQLNGNAEPALYAYVQPGYKFLSGTPVGTNVTLSVTVVNTGSSPATNVVIGNKTHANLPADSSLPTFKVAIPYRGLLQRTINETLVLSWTNATGGTERITANLVYLVLAHSSMAIPYIESGGTATFSVADLLARHLNVTYGFTNAGNATAAVTATQVFPTGITCAIFNSTQATCSGSVASFNFTSIAPQGSENVIVELNFTSDNFIVPPARVTATYAGLTFDSAGSPYVIPGGLTLTKAFSPDVVFPGMPTTTIIGMTNTGSQTLYNVTLSSTADSFDTVGTGQSVEQSYPTVTPGESETFNYTVKVDQDVEGNLTAALPTVTVILGGQTQSVSLGNSSLLVYKPIAASVTVSPATPSNGHDFAVTFSLSNSAPVPVSNVTLTWKLPSGVSAVSGGTTSGQVVTESIASLQANAVQNVTLTLKANIGVTLDTGTGSRLTYSYQGSTIDGVVASQQITVKEDIMTSYEIPIAIAIVITLLAVFYMRRSTAPAVTGRASSAPSGPVPPRS